MTYFATSKDRTRIAYDRIGSGAPVVIVGGALQHRAASPELTLLAQELAKEGFTVVTYDRRGRGESDPGLGGVDREVEDLAAIIQDLGGKASVFGNSSGGLLGLWAAAIPEIGVTKLALFESPLEPSEGFTQRVTTMGERVEADDRDGMITLFFERAPPEFLAAERVSGRWPDYLVTAPTLLNDMQLIARIDERPLNEALAPITIPVLLLTGADMRPSLQARADELATILPAFELHETAAREHSWTPSGMAVSLKQFLG